MTEFVLLSLKIYALAVVISFSVAVMIKLIVLAASDHGRRQEAPKPRALPTASPSAPPADHVAAIAAAVYACLGAHRIVHIEGRGRDRAWTAEGRAAHHVSHNIRPHPHR